MYLKKILTTVAFATFAWAGPSSAALIGYNFGYSGTGYAIDGMFSYDDQSGADADGIISYSELTDLMFNVTNSNGTGSGTLAGTQTINFFSWGNILNYDIASNQLGVTGLVSAENGNVSLWDQSTGAYFFVTIDNAYIEASSNTQGLCQLCSQHFGVPTSGTVTAKVPEPTSLALLGAGVIAFGVMRRKKRKLVE